MPTVYMLPLPCGSGPIYAPRPNLDMQPYIRQGFHTLPSGNFEVLDDYRHTVVVTIPPGPQDLPVPERWALVKPYLLEDIRQKLQAFPEADAAVCCFDLTPCVIDGRVVCAAFISAVRMSDFPEMFIADDPDSPEFTWAEELLWHNGGPWGWQFTLEP